jgi:hypothetical protein
MVMMVNFLDWAGAHHASSAAATVTTAAAASSKGKTHFN